jgi:Domain of unknown function (DUF5916)/Carbohydrate family 9 binding domain-like
MNKLFAILFTLFFTISVNSQSTPSTSTASTPNTTSTSSESLLNIVRKPVTVPKFSTSPTIDGKVDDEIWKQAAVLKDFIQTNPGDNIAPSKPTEVYIGYDEKNLYVAFKCWDEKDKIRATVAQRDGVFSEDNVRFWLDTYDDQRRAYIIGFNPLGIQQDGIFTEGQGADFNIDILMESKGVIEDWGWSVEVKIPFKSLRYTAGKGKFWGFNVARNIDRLNDEFNSWVPLPRGNPGFLNQFGKITGLDEIKTERTLEVIPTLTVKETGRRVSQTRFSNPPITPDFGFTAKYSITPNVTLDAAYNPDFADTEADAPVVEANQRFPIFFQEKRPFFLEGIDIFNTPIQAVYTRRVENPDIAVKLTGKIGRNSFGVFGAIDEPLSNPNKEKAYIGVVRLKRDFGKESNIGFLGTAYNYPNQHNIVGGFDGRWKINKNSEFNAQILGSTSRNYFYEPKTDNTNYRTGNGISYDYSYDYSATNYSWGVSGEGVTKDFRADMGFTSQTNTMSNSIFADYNTDPKPKNLIIRKSFGGNFGIYNDFYGRLQGWGANSSVNLGLKGNTELGGGFSLGLSNIYEDEFGPRRSATNSGTFFGEPKRSTYNRGGYSYFYKSFSKRFSMNSNFNLFFNSYDYDFGGGRRFPRVSPAAIAFGQDAPQDPGPGKSLSFSIGSNFKPTDSFSFNLSYRKSSLRRNDTNLLAFDSNIFQFRSTYQFSRFVNFKARLDYNTLNNRVFGQYTFGWTPSPGKALYVGYNDSYNYKGYVFGQQQDGLLQLNRTFFIKLSYLFRRSF